ncbi:hypothetical protein COL940_008499 [Colletotrichum noveboracense]|nr:hypothetical protein COL940_008499 [Colletotrichum noveboracense]
MDKGNRRSVSSILDWKSKIKSSAILQSDDTPKDNLSPNAGSSQVSTPKSPSNAKGKEPWSLWKDKTAFPLCSDCRKLDFDRFRNPASFDQSTTTHETTLIDISTLIENYKDMQCGFCSLLFDAIAEHDPFQHPAIRDYISEAGLQKIGAGRSSNRTIRLEQAKTSSHWKPTFGRDEKKELQRDLAFAAQTATANVAVMRAIEESNKSNDADVAGILSAVHEMFPAVLSLIKQFNKDSPAAVTVKEVNAGLFTVAVWGFGNAPSPPLSRLNAFKLRVAEPYRPQTEQANYRYGNVIKNRIDIKGTFRGFLDQCFAKHHPQCNLPSWAGGLSAPEDKHFRLVDVYTKQLVSYEELRRSNSGSLPQYAALSYVWGETGNSCLNLQTSHVDKEQPFAALSIDSMGGRVATTITDAIQVTRQLNEAIEEGDGRLRINYLWVDSLCIIQDQQTMSDGRSANQAQIEQMDRIFGNAIIVLVAAGGHHADAGIAGVSSDRVPAQIARMIRDGVNVLLPIKYPSNFGRWDERAWTLQEKLLSKRMLIFGDNHASFHCQHSCGVLREDMSAKDAGNGPPKTDFLSPPTIDRAIKYRERWGLEPIIRRSPLFTEYTKFLEQYTSRDLTMPSDILSGIMGLLNVLDIFSTSSAQSRTNKSNGDITLSGLPEGFLDLALLWQPPPAKQVGLTRRAVGERVFHRETPSWSWAGWDTWKEDLKIQNHPGVRHEDPFWVSTYEDPSLKKIHATQANAEERYRPLVMWYTTKKLDAKSKPDVGPKPADQLATPVQRTLRPVNDNGLGLHFQDSNKDSTQKIIQEFLKRAAQLRRGNTGIPAVPEGVYLKDHYLVCETEVAKFRVSQIKGFREEVLWHSQEKGGGSSKTLYIAELEIRQDLRGKDRAVGYVI